MLIVIGPVIAPAGTVAVMVVAFVTVKLACTLLENLTDVTPVKFVPVIVKLLPIAPLDGLTLLTVGQLVCAAIVKVSGVGKSGTSL